MNELNRKIQPPISPLKNLDLLLPTRSIFPNGARFTLLEKTVQEEVFRLDILVDGGRLRQRQSLQSLFTSKMLSEGTLSMSQHEISEALDRYGAWMGASSGLQSISINLFSLNRYAEETLTVLEKILKEPSFPQKQFEVILGNAYQQYLVSSQKVESKARIAFNKMVLGENHPVSKVAGKAQYESISVADLKEFYQRCFFSANTSVYLSGNPTEKVISLVREKFGDVCWGTSTDPGPIKQVEPVSDVEKFQFIESADALQNAVRMGFVTIPQQHPDFEGLYVLTTLLGGYFGSRLMSNIREDKGYTYGIDAGLIPLPSESVFVIGTQCDVKYVKPLIQEVYHEFDRLKTELVSQEELDMVKNYMLGELARRSEGLYLCDVYTTAEIQGLPDDYLQKRVDAIQRVTVQDIHDLACKYLLPEKVKEVVVGKKI